MSSSPHPEPTTLDPGSRERGECVTEAPRLSFVWIFSEPDDDLVQVLEAYVEAIGRISENAELIIVNNGVRNCPAGELIQVLERSGSRSKILTLYRNTGESAALSAAFREVRGDIVTILPPYLQTDPEDIRRLLREIEEGGLDYVASWRHPRIDSRGAGRLSRIFNWLTRKSTGIRLHDINSGLRAMRRQVIEEVQVYGDLFRFLPVLAAMQGFRIGEVKTRHLQEKVRKGDYRPGIYLRRLLDLLTLFFLLKFTRKPLRFFGLIGSGTLLAGTALCTLLIVQRLLGRMLGDRPIFIIGVLLIVLGIQLFSIGLIGELIIFIHAREIAEYRVEKVYESPRS